MKCFSLAISGLSCEVMKSSWVILQVRANSLQDLVYQQGQSGVRSAVVSLTFDNCDKSRSPREYTDCDEIHVTREVRMCSLLFSNWDQSQANGY